MKYIFFLLIPFLSFGQDCTICPSGPITLDGSLYPSGATFAWSCTNGFTSSLQSPVFSPTESCTCYLLVTQGGCVVEDVLEIEVCDCGDNNPCVSMSYNPSTDCVTFTNNGSSTSTIATSQIQWKNQITSYANIASGATVCGCDIKEYLNTGATCSIDGTKFRLEITGLNDRCAGCTSGDMKIFWQFPNPSYSSTSFPICAQTSDWYSILDLTSANFITAGSQLDAFVQYTTDFGVVVNQYRFIYNGSGLNCSNITIQEIRKGTIYKDITAKRTVTYSDGCPDVVCELTLDIPQQPDNPCFSFTGYMNRINIGSPCSGPGLSANAINGTAPFTYQWSYNGTNISGNVSGFPQWYCLTGQPNGTYCCEVTDDEGCVFEVCAIVQPPCTLGVSVTSSGNTLTANLVNCTGTPSYQWARWNGSSWVNVGTNSSTYNTGGLTGEYRVTVVCTGCTAIGYKTFTPPCSVDVTITTGSTTLTANVTGCSGASIVYTWERLISGVWTFVATTTTTSTSNAITPAATGLYRVSVVCNGCPDQAQTSFTLPDPCSSFSANITGTFINLCQGIVYPYNRTLTGGTSPFSTTWRINGTIVSTSTSYNYTASTLGSFTLSCTVVDALGCTSVDVEIINIIVCCGMTVNLSANLTVCQNENATYTATPTGGATPYTYNWTSQLLPASPISQGSGNPKTFNFPATGSYNIVVQVTDNNGCTATDNATMTVNTCSSCVCVPDLSLTGCELTGTFTGAGCGSFSYQLQYSPTGTGWTTVASGTASSGGTFNYTPTANGIYRLAIFASGCGTTVDDVSVNCFNPTCSNDPVLSLNDSYQEVCGIAPVTVSGNTFGGSATSVTLTENGAGSLSVSTFGTSPFSWTYTPTLADLNNTVTINATSNNPLGSPCVPATDSYGIFVKPIPDPSITSSAADLCNGSTRTLVGTPSSGTFTVISGPGTISGNTLTATGVGAITIRYLITVSGCTNTVNQVINSVACPCQNLTMTTTTLPGRISFGTLLNSGVALTNYRIEWRKCSDNSVVFYSGMGTGAGTGVYPHPSADIPIVAGCYYAYIVTSDVGNNLDCFADVNVVNWSCGTPPIYSYSGPGGSAATRTFQMDINNTVGHIKIAFYNVQTVPDLLEVIYNGSVLYSTSSNIITPIMVSIPYVTGVNVVTFSVTNSTPTQQTIWNLSNISCCTGLDICPDSDDVPEITGATPDEATTDCSCRINFTSEPEPPLTCSPCRNQTLNSAIVGGCANSVVTAFSTCVNDVITITKGTGPNRLFDFSNSTLYNDTKTRIMSVTNSDQYIRLTVKDVICASDGQLLNVEFYPLHSTIVYNDINYTIDITLNGTNPFPNDCEDCDKVRRTKYNDILSTFNNATFFTGVKNALNQTSIWHTAPRTVASSTYQRSIICSSPCGTVLGPNFRLSYRDVNCPCQSWQIHRDDSNDFGTLINQASGWTGSCL